MANIIMVTNPVYPDKVGGLERYVREFSEAMIARGHSVCVVSKRTSSDQPAQETLENGMQIRRYSAPSKRDPLFAAKYAYSVPIKVREIVRSLLSEHPDSLIHGHFAVPCLRLNRLGCPFVYTFHAPAYRELLGERQGSYALPRAVQHVAVVGLRMVERAVLRRASKVFVLSDFMRREAGALVPEVLESAVVIPGGIGTGRFCIGPGIQPRPLGDPILFSARRLVHRTGVDLLVGAMPGILEKNPNAMLYLAGSGPLEESLRDQIRELGLGDAIKLLGRVDDDRLVEWYQTADLCITPTRELEGFGLSTAEALACGTPCVVTPAGANAEVVTGLSPQYLSRTVDSASLARSVNDLIAVGPRLGRTPSDIRNFVLVNFGWQRVCADYELAYERVLSPSRRASMKGSGDPS